MGVFKKTASPGVFSSFKGTQHSERLRLTFEEVQTFKRQLLKEEAALRVYTKATDEILKVTDDSLSAFPRVWRKADESGAATLPEEDITKAAPSSKSLSAHPSKKFVLDLDMKLQDDVYTPLQRWHKQYKHIKVQIAAVEAARHEYDSARKDVAAAREAILKHARKTDGRDDPSLNTHEAQAETILANKRERYVAVEHEVHNELVALAADSQAMLGLVAHALQLQAQALMGAGEALRQKELDMPKIERETSGPLSLGTPGASLQGSPVGTPTAAAASPTGYGASFKSPGFEASPPTSPMAQAPTGATEATPEEVAMRAKEYKTGTPTSNLGDSGRMGRFDEQAVYEKEKAAGADGAAPNAQMSNMSVNDQPATTTGGVKDSVTELPSAPTHPVERKEEAQPAQTTAGSIISSIFGSRTATPAE